MIALQWHATRVPPGTVDPEDTDTVIEPGWYVTGHDPEQPDGPVVQMLVEHTVFRTNSDEQPEQTAQAIARALSSVDTLRADMRIRQGALNDVLGRDRSQDSPTDYYDAVEDVAELKRALALAEERIAKTRQALRLDEKWSVQHGALAVRSERDRAVAERDALRAQLAHAVFVWPQDAMVRIRECIADPSRMGPRQDETVAGWGARAVVKLMESWRAPVSESVPATPDSLVRHTNHGCNPVPAVDMPEVLHRREVGPPKPSTAPYPVEFFGGNCPCKACVPVDAEPFSFIAQMHLCPKCGNKRCPGAKNHAQTCSGSNAPNQPGSLYDFTDESHRGQCAEDECLRRCEDGYRACEHHVNMAALDDDAPPAAASADTTPRATSAIEAALEHLPHRCWILVHKETERPWENGDYVPHFANERAAIAQCQQLQDPFAYKLARISYCCLIGPDCVACEGSFSDWMDGASHCTPGKARQEIEQNDWRWTPRGWYCGDCTHLLDEVLPNTEQEAGQ